MRGLLRGAIAASLEGSVALAETEGPLELIRFEASDKSAVSPSATSNADLWPQILMLKAGYPRPPADPEHRRGGAAGGPGCDFNTRVEGVRRRDEIGDLAGRMNEMIGELSERVELMKFVSRGTVSAIQAAGAGPMDRVGERRRVAVLFSDIRGYTAFSETVAPEIAVRGAQSLPGSTDGHRRGAWRRCGQVRRRRSGGAVPGRGHGGPRRRLRPWRSSAPCPRWWRPTPNGTCTWASG